jgi:hypothetical protein
MNWLAAGKRVNGLNIFGRLNDTHENLFLESPRVVEKKIAMNNKNNNNAQKWEQVC